MWLGNCLAAIKLFLDRAESAFEAGALDEQLVNSLRNIKAVLLSDYNNAMMLLVGQVHHEGTYLDRNVQHWL